MTWPLADLHVHLRGCVSADELLAHLEGRTGLDWSRHEELFQEAYGRPSPARDLVERSGRGEASARDEFRELFVVGDADAGSFARFSAKGSLLWVGTTPGSQVAEAMGFARGIHEHLAQEGVSYAELRSIASAELLEQLHATRSPTLRLAVSLARTDPWKDWEQVQALALGPHGEAITAIDFCNVEEGHPPKTLAGFLGQVHAFNREHPSGALAILYHVGESFGDKSLESAVRWVQEAAELGAHRLGHAIALGMDPLVRGEHTRTEPVSERTDQVAYDLAHAATLRAAGVEVDEEALRAEQAVLMDRGEELVTHHYDQARLREVGLRQEVAMAAVRRAGAVVEVCPTSNRVIGGIRDVRPHVRRFLAAGLPVVVGSDDPGQFETTLAAELEALAQGQEGLREQLLAMAWASRSEVLSGRE